ncbi:MAG: hypothetical protein M3Y65_18145 [Pseudomonadota bacterium]|nr:hypothetical protein [Pseudomonadota bacterium]
MISYAKLFNNLREKLESETEFGTTDITRMIKEFFAQEFSGYFVAPSPNVKEFLVDVFVATRNPREFSSESAGEEFKAILAVESELGGTGGGSQQYLMRNVLEDFSKLLVIKSEYKALIFTSLPYAAEEGHINNRLREIEAMYSNAGHPGNILLIHLRGSSQKTRKGDPTNPKISLSRAAMSAYILSKGVRIYELA